MNQQTKTLIALLEANGFRSENGFGKHKDPTRIEELGCTCYHYYKTYWKKGTTLACSAYTVINEWDEKTEKNEYGEDEIIEESHSDHDEFEIEITETKFEIPDLEDLVEITTQAREELKRLENDLTAIEKSHEKGGTGGWNS